MVLKRSNHSAFGRLLLWTLCVSAGIIAVFNIVFVLQFATELAILKTPGLDKTTFPSLFKEKRDQYEATSEGKFNFLFSFSRIKISFSPLSSKP